MRQAYITPGKAATLARKNFRKDVAAGRASWTPEGYEHDARGRLVSHPDIKSGPPVAPVRVALPTSRRPFGEGLGERHPVYRLPGDVTPDDISWWEAEAQREQDREIDRRFAEYTAMDRLSRGLDPY